MNIHHLELFYYVAKHRGISEAARQMPYGIQQPAISSQLLQLENELGVTLFQRRPFKLTEQGEKLHQFVAPFFDGIPMLAQELTRSSNHEQLKIGASDQVLANYIPELMRRLRKSFPQLRLQLRSGLHKDLEECLATGRVDVIVSVLKEEKRMGVERQKLLDVPLVLAVPQESSLNSAADILKEDTIRHPLICLPEDEWITSRFLQELEAKGKTWLPSIEVRSLELLRKFVLEGYGVGLSVAVPGEQHTGMKIFSLDEFSPVPIGISWRSKTPPVQALIAETISLARALAPGKK